MRRKAKVSITEGVRAVVSNCLCLSTNYGTARGQLGLFETRTQAASSQINSTINFIFIDGYASVGDGGTAIYTRLSAAPVPVEAWHFQSADGAYWQYSPTDGVNVRALGAKGNGTTDDGTAIHNAVNAAYTFNCAVYFPFGNYRITQDAVLTQTVDTAGRGMQFVGDGVNNSLLMLDPAGSDIYFFNNGSTLGRARGNWYSDLTFTSKLTFSTFADISDHAKGFRVYGTGVDAEHTFTDCAFSYLNNCFETAGTNGTDSFRFSQCKFNNIKNNVLLLQNSQSVCHTFINTHIESIYGDIFNIDTGGAITYYGGSIIPLSDKGVDTYIMRLNAVGGFSVGDHPILISGARVELRGNKTNILSIGSQQQANVNFDACLFFEQGTVDKLNAVKVDIYGNVNFNKCTFFEINGGRLFFVAGNNTYFLTQFGENGTIVFDGCGVPVDWSDRCSLLQFTGGVMARNCYGLNVTAPINGFHWANDFDLHWNEPTPGIYSSWTGNSGTSGQLGGGSLSNGQLRTKTAYLFISGEIWPDGGTTLDMTLRMPRNAIIKSIHLRKEASGADATVGTFQVTRADKTGTPHLVTGAAQFHTAFSADVTSYFYHVGTTDNERNLTLSWTGANTGASVLGGFVIVEYI